MNRLNDSEKRIIYNTIDLCYKYDMKLLVSDSQAEIISVEKKFISNQFLIGKAAKKKRSESEINSDYLNK